jgi:hypothetical protein
MSRRRTIRWIEVRIDIRSAEEDGRIARRRALDLVAAYAGGTAGYVPLLEERVNALLRLPQDTVALAERLAHLLDGATVVAFVLASALAEREKKDLAEVLTIVESAIDKHLEAT